VSVAILVILALLIFLVRKNKEKNSLSPLTILAIGLASAGTIYTSDRFLSFSLLGAGMAVALFEMWRLAKKK